MSARYRMASPAPRGYFDTPRPRTPDPGRTVEPAPMRAAGALVVAVLVVVLVLCILAPVIPGVTR